MADPYRSAAGRRVVCDACEEREAASRRAALRPRPVSILDRWAAEDRAFEERMRRMDREFAAVVCFAAALVCTGAVIGTVAVVMHTFGWLR